MWHSNILSYLKDKSILNLKDKSTDEKPSSKKVYEKI